MEQSEMDTTTGFLKSIFDGAMVKWILGGVFALATAVWRIEKSRRKRKAMREAEFPLKHIPGRSESKVAELLESGNTKDLLDTENRIFETIGLEEEKKELDKFILDEAPLKVKVVIGVNGSGKSHLAYDLCDRMPDISDAEWAIGFLESRESFSKFIEDADLSAWWPKTNILIFIDDAAGCAHEISIFLAEILKANLEKISSERGTKKTKIRILLLDREAYFNLDGNWLNGVYRNLQREIKKKYVVNKILGIEQESASSGNILEIPIIKPNSRIKIVKELFRTLSIKEDINLNAELMKQLEYNPALGTMLNLLMWALLVREGRKTDNANNIALGFAELEIAKLEKITEKDGNFHNAEKFLTTLLIGVMIRKSMNREQFQKFYAVEHAYWLENRLGDEIPKGQSGMLDARISCDKCFNLFRAYFRHTGSKLTRVVSTVLEPNYLDTIKEAILISFADTHQGNGGMRDMLEGLFERCGDAESNFSIFENLARIPQDFWDTYRRDSDVSDPHLWVRVIEKNTLRQIKSAENLSEIMRYLDVFPMNSMILPNVKIAALKKALAMLENASNDGDIENKQRVKLQLAEAQRNSTDQNTLCEALKNAQTAGDFYEEKIKEIQQSPRQSMRNYLLLKAAKARYIQSLIQMKMDKSTSSLNEADSLADKAREHYENARQQGKANFPLGEYTACLVDSGSIREKLGDNTEAIKFLNSVIELYGNPGVSEDPEQSSPEIAAAYLERGRIKSIIDSEKNAFDDTEIAWKNYRNLQKNQPDVYTPDFGTAYNHLSDRLRDMRRYSESLDAANESRRIFETLDGIFRNEYKPYRAGSLINLANLLEYNGEYRESFDCIKTAYDIRNELFQSNNNTYKNEYIEASSLIAQAYSRWGERKKAIHFIQDAVNNLDILLENDSVDNQRLYAKVQERHAVILANNDSLKIGLAELTKAAGVHKRLFNQYGLWRYRNDYAAVLIELSDILRESGFPGKAFGIAEKAVRILNPKKESESEQYPSTLYASAMHRSTKSALEINKIQSIIEFITEEKRKRGRRGLGRISSALDIDKKILELYPKKARMDRIDKFLDYASMIPGNDKNSAEKRKGLLTSAQEDLLHEQNRFSDYPDIAAMYHELTCKRQFVIADIAFSTGDYVAARRNLNDCISNYGVILGRRPLCYGYRILDCKVLLLRTLLRTYNPNSSWEFYKKTLDEIRDFLEKKETELCERHSKPLFCLRKAEYYSYRSELSGEPEKDKARARVLLDDYRKGVDVDRSVDMFLE